MIQILLLCIKMKIKNAVCGPIDHQNNVIQLFNCPVNYLSGLSVRLGTYKKTFTHRIQFKLFSLNSDFQSLESLLLDKPFFELDIDAKGVIDNQYFHFYFPTLAASQGLRLALMMTSPDAEIGHAVTAYLANNDSRIPGHIHFLSKNIVSNDLGLQAKLITSEPMAVNPYPQGLLYSPYSSCNMNCTHCISRHSRKRAIRMSERIKQDIKKQVEQRQLQWIFTDYSGDIFFADHKNKGELDFLLNLGIAIHIDTNGAYLDSQAIEKLMLSEVDALSISVDAAQDDTYHKIRVGSPLLEQIFATARKVVDARAEYGRQDNFKICMGFTMMLSNLHELPLFIQRAAQAGVDSVGCRHLEVYHSDMKTESLFNHKAYFNSIRAASIELAKSLSIKLLISEELKDYPSSSARMPCLSPWTSAVVLANGDVMACCVPGSKMGNVNEVPLEEIWQGAAYQQLRSRVNSANPPSLCKTCPFTHTLSNYDSLATLASTPAAIPLLNEFKLN